MIFNTSLFGQTANEWFESGIEAMQNRKMEEASVYFSKASDLVPLSSEYQFYIGLCKHQVGHYTEAELAYTKSLSLGGNPDTILLRRGNLRWIVGNIEGALDDYSTVIDGGGPSASSALLNRANLALNQSMFETVIKDYTTYLAMEPMAPDRINIEKILALLTAEAEAARIAEAKRLAEEARRAEEEAKRKALLDDLISSLDDTGDDTKSKSAGMENIRTDLEESTLED